MANRTVYVDGTTSGSPGGGAHYATLSACMTGEFTVDSGDLSVTGGILTVQCSYISGGDTTGFNMPAWTGMSSVAAGDASDNYIHFIGDNASGVWNTSAYFLSVSWTPALYPPAHSRVTRLQVAGTGNLGIRLNTHHIILDGCLVKSAVRWGILFDSTATDCVAKNCIAYDCGDGTATYAGFGWLQESAGTNYCFCCTAVDCNPTGFHSATVQTAVCTNCLGYSNTSYDFDHSAGTFTLNYCASSDSTADDHGGTGHVTGISDPFVNSGADNFHLAATATDLINTASDLYGNTTPNATAGAVTTDIDNATLTVRNDIGADEYVAAGGPTAITVNRTDNLNG